jgi:WD40 repeat protein
MHKIRFTPFLFLSLQPTYCVQEYSGHSSAIMSLDFHPKKTDFFCFCDSENEIRYYNISSSSCTRVSKVGQTNAFCHMFFKQFYASLIFITMMFQGGNAKVRFQPGSGQLLAAASDKVVSIFDVETDRQIYSLQVKSTVYLFIYIFFF